MSNQERLEDYDSDDDRGKMHEPEQLRKMFIGGLDYGTTDEVLKEFYEQWGTVVDVVVMKDPKTRRSRGFGFITYSKAAMVDDAMANRPHKIDGRQVEPKRAVPRDLCGKGETNVRKLFIGGIGKLIDKEDLEEYFGKYGTLTDCAIVVTKDTGERRGFGFVEYDDVDAADKVILIRDHEIKGRRVEVKKAIARDDMRNDGGRGGGMDKGRGGGGRDGRDGRGGRGGDYRNNQGNYGGGWNNQGNNWGGNHNSSSPWSNQSNNQMGNWGGNQNSAWGNNPCWGNNQNGYQGFNNNNNNSSMGMGGGGMGMGGGGNMNNMGMGGGMGGNMGMGMGGGMGGGNMGGGMGGNMGGGMGGMGGGGGGYSTGNMGGGGNMGYSSGNFGGSGGGGPMRGGNYNTSNRSTPYSTSGGNYGSGNDRRGSGGGGGGGGGRYNN